MVQCLPSKLEAQSSNFSTKKEGKEEGREGGREREK
jgi:hypothetical protein